MGGGAPWVGIGVGGVGGEVKKIIGWGEQEKCL